MRSLKIIIPAILLFLLVVGGIYTIYQAQVAPRADLTTANLPTPPKNNFPESTASAKPQVNSTSVTNQPATGPEDELEIKNIGISVSNITPGQQITSPLTLSGVANVTSQTVIIKVSDNTGNILGQGQATTCISLTGCNFEASIAFQKPQIQTGYIEVYSPSTINNEPLFLQTIPVSF